MLFEIKPFDPLFFRDGKPFTMGDDTFANSVFPPPPSTVYGALRSAYIAHNGGLDAFISGEMRDAVGTPDEPGSFAVRGVFIKANGQIHLPAPLDLGREKDPAEIARKDRLHRLVPVPKEKLPCVFPPERSTGLTLLPKRGLQIKDCSGYFISSISFREYLVGEGKEFQGIPLREIVEREPKLGIKRDPETSASQEGFLYRVSMLRMGGKNPDGSINDASLIVESEGEATFPAEYYIRLGGDGKPCMVKNLDDKDSPHAPRGDDKLMSVLKARIEKDGKFKLYLATPAIFENGWLPMGAENRAGDVVLKRNGLQARLLYASVGKPMHVGGWDIQRNKPKIMRKTVPAGSVFCFELLSGDGDGVLREFDYRNITDFFPEQGFGLAFVGAA